MQVGDVPVDDIPSVDPKERPGYASSPQTSFSRGRWRMPTRVAAAGAGPTWRPAPRLRCQVGGVTGPSIVQLAAEYSALRIAKIRWNFQPPSGASLSLVRTRVVSYCQ